MFNPRPAQAEVLKYRGGRMGVSAVPGSGKTHTLSGLAAQLILDDCLNPDQEVLIVTLVNSAVDNFSSRIAGFVKEAGLLENVGYRVRTLHGLAHDIIRERPEKAGISERFTIIDEGESAKMISEITAAALRDHPELVPMYVNADLDAPGSSQTRKQWVDLMESICVHFISQAKDYRAEPGQLAQLIEERKVNDPLMLLAVDVYTQYQRGLRFRNAVDFNDLIRLAYRVLVEDNEYLLRLRYRWKYILEDEAQDSSKLQEEILNLLAGPDGNWVRVGDPNQAIYETFTTANPKYLRNFLKTPGVDERDLPNSGRSNMSIIGMANALIRWTNTDHPVDCLRKSLATPFIEPAPPGDPQPNPPDQPNAVYIHKTNIKSDREIQVVISSLKSWLPANPDKTVAVLVPIGKHGEKVVEALNQAGIKVVEMLKSSQSTRKAARIFEKLFLCLADPSNNSKCVKVFQEIYEPPIGDDQAKEQIERLSASLQKAVRLEELFYPLDQLDLPALLKSPSLSSSDLDILTDFRQKMIRWHAASSLPVDQLVLTVAQDLFTSSADLALAHKFALLLEFAASNHPEYQLANFADDLKQIAANERKFLGFTEEDNGINPEQHKGEVFVLTYHKAKGLEWDRVYLLSVNNYDFPSAQEGDEYFSEKWFINGRQNLEADLLAKLRTLLGLDEAGDAYSAQDPTIKARQEYSAERLRLFYVGITRARESLIITWNTGKFEKSTMSLPLQAMLARLEEKNASA